MWWKVYSLKDQEFWIDPQPIIGLTFDGFNIHHAYDYTVNSHTDYVQFVEKRRLNIALARISELEELRDKLKKELEIKNAIS